MYMSACDLFTDFVSVEIQLFGLNFDGDYW